MISAVLLPLIAVDLVGQALCGFDHPAIEVPYLVRIMKMPIVPTCICTCTSFLLCLHVDFGTSQRSFLNSSSCASYFFW